MSIFENIEKTIFENKDYLKEEVFRLMKVELMREYLTPSTFKIVISEDDFEIKTVEVNDIRTDIDGHHTLFTSGRYVEGKGWFKFDKESAFTLEDQVDEFLTNVKIKVDEYLKLSLIYTVLEEVMTVSEAANKWGKVEGTIRAAIKSGKFTEEIDYRKARGTVLVTREAMERVYGKLEDTMESKMAEIRNKVFEIVKHEEILGDEVGEITKEAYFYCVGRSLQILQKHTRYKEPINKYLNAASIEVLKDYKRTLLKKYMNEFVQRNERNGVEWNIVTLTYSYEPGSYTEEDKDILLFGYLDTTKYPKSEK